MSRPPSRRAVLAAGLAIPKVAQVSAPAAEPFSSLLSVNYPKLVARADLHYDQPVVRSEEGMPIGNGRVGTLVWTTPTALKLQINRPDVFGNSCESRSFSERHTDYSSGCGYIDIDFPGFEDVFSGAVFSQHLSVYDGLLTTQGRGVSIRTFASQDHDVIAVEVDDRRAQAGPVHIDLRMLRYTLAYQAGKNWELTSTHTVAVRHRSHTAASRLQIHGDRILLIQQFSEGTHFSASAIAVAVTGRGAKPRYVDESTVRLAVASGYGRFTILIGSAASLVRGQDAASASLGAVDAIQSQGVDSALEASRRRWRKFWSKSLLHLQSTDASAEFVEKNYTYFLYVMACCSRGAYPPRFGGLLFGTNGDMREWGAQHWWHNTSCYYDALPPTNRFDLMDPVFGMYTRLAPSLERAARQQWDSQGIWIPETVWFDGLENLPDDIASEMRDLYLLRKPWDERSQRFRDYADTKHPHSSRWNWKGQGRWIEGRFEYKDKGAGPFGEVTHIFSTGAKISFLYWLRFLYTGDESWLRDRAYPMLKGVAEFYRNHPNLRRGGDGRFHIHDANDHEPIKGAQDTLEEITAMRFIFPVAARAAAILDTDSDVRERWLEIAGSLAPLPTSYLRDAIGGRRPAEPCIWDNGRTPIAAGNPTRGSDHLLTPAIHYDLVNVSTADRDLLNVANATFDSVYPGGSNEKSIIHVLSRAAIAAAHLGRASDIRFLVPNQIRCLDPERDFCDWVGGGRTGVLRNRLTLREGPGAIDCQRLGRAAAALHLALLQAVSPEPDGDPVLYIFPAWPKEWDAAFTLLTAGAFLVTSSMRQGRIEFVEILSQAGAELRLKNPWNTAILSVFRNGQTAGETGGSQLKLPTTRGETLILAPAGANLQSLRRTIEA
jgi:hypothetical protein